MVQLTQEIIGPAALVAVAAVVAAADQDASRPIRQASAQSKLVKTCELGASALERRQFWKWITMPTISIGATTAMAKSGDNGFGEISSITIPETNQSVVKLTVKSSLGTRSQYRRAVINVAGAIAAPAM
jgi:hypothetical protein